MFPRRTRISFAAFLAISVTLLLLGLFALLLPLDTTQAQTQPEALGSLRGTIRNDAGDPLPNITVFLRQFRFGENRQVTSDAAGVYEFRSLPSGTYTLQFTDPDKRYATEYYVDADFNNDARTVIVNGNDVGNVNMELGRAGAISLTLESSSPFSPTTLIARLYRQSQTGTWLTYRETFPEFNVQHFHFDRLPAGNYRLCATLTDQLTSRYATECYDNITSPDVEQLAPNASDIAVQPGQEQRIAIDFNDPSQVEGTVVSPGGVPLAGIYMMLMDESGYNQLTVASDENGRFQFPTVAAGIYRLVYNTPVQGPNDYLPLYYPNSLSIATAESLQIDAETHISVTQKMRRAAQITGKVTLPGDVPANHVFFTPFRQWRDGSYNQFVECHYACIPTQTYDPMTGAYTVTQLIPGNYRIGVNYYLPNSQGFVFQFYGGDSLEQADTIALGEGASAGDINFVVGEGQFDGAIKGQVTTAGQPVAGIEVGVFLYGYYYDNRSALPLFSTVTDADGRYLLEGLASGHYLVGARDPDGDYATTFYNQIPPETQIYPAPVPGEALWVTGTGTVNNVDLALAPGATIRGHVRVQDVARGDFTVQAAPLNEYYIDPYYLFPAAYSDVRTDATGYYEITGLVSGTYQLRAYEPYGNGDFLGSPLFYPGTYDVYGAQPVTLTTGQTLENYDFWHYSAPTNFLPVIDNGPAEDDGTDGGGEVIEEPPQLPTPTPPVILPVPTPTPTLIAQ